MIRSTSKLLKKGGSVRNINKSGAKWRFVVQFETATRILSNSDVVVTWERKGVVLATDPVQVDRATRTADFTGSKLSQVVTLFKPKKGDMNYDSKEYTISIRHNNDKGKTIGRIILNFADYVAMPEFSKRMVAKLSHDGEIIMRVTSTYVGEAKKRKSSQGSSSVSSATASGRHKDVEDTSMADLNDQSDLTDLELPDFDDEPVSSRSLHAKKEPAPQLAPSRSRRDRDRERRDREREQRTSAVSSVTRSASRRDREREAKNVVPTVSEMNDTIPTRSKATNVSDTGARTVTRAEYDKVKQQNRALTRKNNDLLAQNEELEDKLASAGLNSNVGKVDMLEGELERMRKEVRDLKSRLSREPVYADVVRELKDAKMALAILSTENAELKSRRR